MSQLVTGEAVVLQVRIARMPTRALACAIDVILQLVVLGVLISLLAGFLIGGEASEALAVALIFVVVLVVMVGYRLVMETLTRGRTLGKMVLGLKVVRDDGSSIRFRHALVRTLMWFFVDFAPWFAACPGIVASLMNKQGKRIGDMVSGTVVIRERHQPMASPPLFVPGHLVQWAQSLELSRLSDELANASREYLARYTELLPDARNALGDALAYRVGQVTAPAPPVPIVAPAYLSAVLAERRRRELTRLATARPALNTGPFGPPNPYAVAVAPAGPYGVPAGPFVPPSPYGVLPPTPAMPGAPGPFPAPAPAAPYRPVAVNPQGWAAPGSNESGQWF
ncbi:putative RDD family membrane protein YckC [Kribbella steppae]|uniref:Putative RDD family membrane protein YckC n=1 Tax=Kribbella steppae TaxID=2512223 RepID=A0A4R2GZR9_9ACTN|nr:RDD family protein [Kribbella steppae]TCO16945.1 putative RDD family membrane protein YckC [Kribbella steppae]